MNEKTIQNALWGFCGQKQHKPIISNYYFMKRSWESDLISVTASDLVHEFEIKCTVSDFKADFRNKKMKHKHMKDLMNKKPPFHATQKMYMPNYFWFVLAENVWKESIVIPDYAGIICVKRGTNYQGKKSLRARLVKNAPRLHTTKICETEKISMGTGLMYRYWNLRVKEENKQ